MPGDKKKKGKLTISETIHLDRSGTTTEKHKKKTKKQKIAKEESKGYAPGLLGGIGSAIGTYFGAGPGGILGKTAGDWLGHITGMGAYKVRVNSLTSGSVPTFADGAGTTVCHREFIADITGSTAFNLQSYAINPGQSSLFPWLSQFASLFEEYQLKGMVIEFKTTSADALNSTNTALGTVIMATDYDDYDSLFTTKQQMEAYQYSTSAKPSESQLHPIECDPKQNVLKNLFVRSGAPAVGSDQRFYDVGNFQIATVGMQAAAVIGELWVSYHVKFLKPKLPTPVNATAGWVHVVENPLGAASATNRFGANGGTVVAGSTISVVAGLVNGVKIIYPGTYFVLAYVVAGSSLGANLSLTLGGNISLGNLVFQDNTTASITTPYSNGALTAAMVVVSAAGTGGPNQISLGGVSSLTAGTTDFIAFLVPTGVTLSRVLGRRIGDAKLEARLAYLEQFIASKGAPASPMNDLVIV